MLKFYKSLKISNIFNYLFFLYIPLPYQSNSAEFQNFLNFFIFHRIFHKKLNYRNFFWISEISFFVILLCHTKKVTCKFQKSISIHMRLMTFWNKVYNYQKLRTPRTGGVRLLWLNFYYDILVYLGRYHIFRWSS